MLPTPSFHSSRLIYRAPSLPADSDWIIQLVRSPLQMLQANASVLRPISKDPTHPYNAELLKMMTEENLLSVIICLPLPNTITSQEQAGERIGVLHLWNPMGPKGLHHRRAEFGINLGEGFQGKGYGPESLHWLLYQGFHRLHLHKIQGSAFSFNKAARKCYRKVGFREEGELQGGLWIEGEWRGEVLLGILEQDWRRMQQEQQEKKEEGGQRPE